MRGKVESTRGHSSSLVSRVYLIRRELLQVNILSGHTVTCRMVRAPTWLTTLRIKSNDLRRAFANSCLRETCYLPRCSRNTMQTWLVVTSAVALTRSLNSSRGRHCARTPHRYEVSIFVRHRLLPVQASTECVVITPRASRYKNHLINAFGINSERHHYSRMTGHGRSLIQW